MSLSDSRFGSGSTILTETAFLSDLSTGCGMFDCRILGATLVVTETPLPKEEELYVNRLAFFFQRWVRTFSCQFWGGSLDRRFAPQVFGAQVDHIFGAKNKPFIFTALTATWWSLSETKPVKQGDV